MVTYQAIGKHTPESFEIECSGLLTTERKKLPIVPRRVTYPSGKEGNRKETKTNRSIVSKASNPGMVIYQTFVGSKGPGTSQSPVSTRGLVTYPGPCWNVFEPRSLLGSFRGERGSYLPPVPLKAKTKKDHTRQSLKLGSFARGLGTNGFGLLIRRTARTIQNKTRSNMNFPACLLCGISFSFEQKTTHL